MQRHTPQLLLQSPEDINKEIALRLKNVRKRRKISQKQLAIDSGVSYASIRKFESTGMISFISLTKIAITLGYKNDLLELFTTPVYLSIEEVINEQR